MYVQEIKSNVNNVNKDMEWMNNNNVLKVQIIVCI